MAGEWWNLAVTAFGGEPVSAPEEDGEAGTIRLDGQDVVLHCWPVGATTAQVNLTQQALTQLDGGVFPVPVSTSDGSWSIEIGGRLVSGAVRPKGRVLHRYGEYRTPDGMPIDLPLPVSSPAPEVVLEAVRQIGRFHTATADLVIRERAGSASLQRLLRGAKSTWSTQRRVVGDGAASSPEIRRWLRCGNRVLPVATELLEAVDEVATTNAVIHGNIWPVDLLIEGRDEERHLTGIVGWTAMRDASPLIDLAQLAIHTANWSGALAESVLGAYAETGRVTPMERRLLPVVAALDLLPHVGDLLHLAYVDDAMIGHESQPVLRSGLKMLLTSLENLTDVLAPDAEWGQRKANEGRQYRQTRPVRKPGGSRKTPGRTPGSGRSNRG
jgi:hypothetical protein